MRSRILCFVISAGLLAAPSPGFAGGPRIHRGPTSPKLFKEHGNRHLKAAVVVMEPARATQIQTALIRAGYLTGAPSGQWDSESQTAMQRLQADNGWQTRLVPDSRAIIKLGLGPSAESSEMAIASANETASETASVATGSSK